MNNVYPAARIVMAALALFSLTCGGGQRQAASSTTLQNRPTPESPAAAAAVDGDEDMVTKALEARMAALHHTAVSTQSIALHPRPDGATQGFYVYAFSTFEAWQGERREEGKLDDIVAAVEKADAECEAEHEQEVAEAEEEYEELEAVAEASGTEEDREAADQASYRYEEANMESPECNAWEEYYPGAVAAAECAPDVLVLVAFTVNRAASAKKPDDLDSKEIAEITEIARKDETGCGVSESEHDIAMQSGDFDQDGKPEVLWIVPATDRVDVGRGSFRAVTRSLTMEILDHTLESSQHDWSIEFAIDSEGEHEQSVISRIWFADRNRDGHPDLVHRQVELDGACTCDSEKFQAAAGTEPRGLDDSWDLIQDITVCNISTWDGAKPCTVVKDSVQELIYDRDSDSWI